MERSYSLTVDWPVRVEHASRIDFEDYIKRAVEQYAVEVGLNIFDFENIEVSVVKQIEAKE